MRKYLTPFQNFFNRLTTNVPTNTDAGILSVFAVLITLQPYFLHGGINLFELGIYLPGINAFLDGSLPFRDFFHLRGPLEIYIPAFFMSLFGENIAILSAYFYIGTVLGLIVCAFIGKELYKSRLVLYLMIPVLIGRTFPRAVFHIWGGLRFSMGLLSILFIIYFLKRKDWRWILLAGITSALSSLISIEIGACLFLCIGTTLFFASFFKLQETTTALKSMGIYIAGMTVILLPYGIYLLMTNSLVPYIDSTLSVVRNMTGVFPDHLFEEHPRNLIEAIMGMSPWSPHFKHLTPAYFYLIGFLFLFWRIRKNQLKESDLPVLSIFIYGFVMYVLAFRKIGAGQFEMALQPEKILYFLLFEWLVFFFMKKRLALKNALTANTLMPVRKNTNLKIYAINLFIAIFVFSSLGYSIQRYSHRFFAFRYFTNLITGGDSANKLIASKNEDSRATATPRTKGMVIPTWQADDFDQLIDFINKNTAENEPVFMFSEAGSYSFIVDRPFIGRFPMVTFSWMNERWHESLVKDLKKAQPRYAVLPKVLDETFHKVYFKIEKNKKKFDEIMKYIDDNYTIVAETPTLHVYKKK